MTDDVGTLLRLAGICPPPDRAEALIAGIRDLRAQAEIVRRLAAGEPATVFRVDPLG